MLNASIQQFQVPLHQQSLLQPNSGLTFQQKKDCVHTFAGLLICQIFWVAIIISYHYTFIFNIVLSFGASAILVWSIIGYIFKNVSVSQFVFFMCLALYCFMYVFAEDFGEYHFLLCGSSTLLALLAVYEVAKYNKLMTVRVLIYPHIFYGCIVYNACKQGDIKIQDWTYVSILLDIYCLGTIFVLYKLYKRWDTFPYVAKFRINCLFYICTILLSICLAASFAQFLNLPWEIFTILSHLSFLQLMYVVYKKRHHFMSIQFNVASYPQRFQVSDCLLIGDQDYLENPRESMQGGKDLSPCIMCMSNQSLFCYEDCGHMSVCPQCAPVWLTKKVQRCPICRSISNYLLRVRRKDGIIFEVRKKYTLN